MKKELARVKGYTALARYMHQHGMYDAPIKEVVDPVTGREITVEGWYSSPPLKTADPDKWVNRIEPTHLNYVILDCSHLVP